MASQRILKALDKLTPITLGEMDAVKLMNRIDTKFVTTEDKLAEFLELAVNDYRVLEIEGKRCCGYDSLYYDTPEQIMYLDHHNKRAFRKKIRVRTYLESGISFLEIKRKNNHGRTKKRRVPCDPKKPFESENKEFTENVSGYSVPTLSPALYTRFERITLVSHTMTERLTIDLNLNFENVRSGQNGAVPGCVIIELKQEGHIASKTKDFLRELRIKPMGMSKYAIGTAMTDPNIKKGNFSLRIRKIEKIIKSNTKC